MIVFVADNVIDVTGSGVGAGVSDLEQDTREKHAAKLMDAAIRNFIFIVVVSFKFKSLKIICISKCETHIRWHKAANSSYT